MIAAGFFGFQLYKAYANERALNAELQKVQSETTALINNNQNLTQQINYYADPYNLEKKLRSETNYRLPNEKLIITTPSATSSQ